ncbi:MAG: IS630 family transposase [Verrucomicrobiaceae bacterium]|nr:MAG: IS630 family transposase [Verrucomicrobiaceae bacterium]
MSRKRTEIISPDAEEVERLLHATTDARDKERLIVARMAMSGQHTLAMMARVSGRSRSTIQVWLERFREGGVEALLERSTAPGSTPSLDFEVQAQMVEKLRNGAWRTARELRMWLERDHSIKLSLAGCYYWLGKLLGRLKAPRPIHAKQAAGAVIDFKMSGWEERLNSLDIPHGAPVRFWIMDESRFGLHTVVRRCWGLPGIRVVKSFQQRFEWEYLYGSINIITGEPVFYHMPEVTCVAVNLFLGEIAAGDPDAHHVVLWDGAGFHQPPDPDDPECPDLTKVHVLKLPPYCPELNPVEKVWDQLKDAVCNRVFKSIEDLRQGLLPKLQEFWENPLGLSSLIGNNWLRQKISKYLAGHFTCF